MSNYSDNALAANNKNTAWAQVLELIKPNWTILDVGCSSGNLGEELIRIKGATVDGIEIDAEDAKVARTKLRHVETLNVEAASGLAKLFKARYDAILLIDVVEHLVDPVSALEKLKPLLKPGGVVIFSIPNMAHVSIRLALMKGDFTYTQTGLLDKTHLHFYTGEEVRRVFKSAGYRIGDFQASSLQYPPSLYEEKFKDLGLSIKNKKQFLDMMSDTRGNVYQFVGNASPATGRPSQPEAPKVNVHEKDYQQLQQIFTAQKKHIKFLEKSVKLKDDHIRNLEAIIEDQKNRSLRRRLQRKGKSSS